MYNFIKRVIDLIASLFGLLFLSPLLLVVSVLIFIEDPGPIFFRQKRIGKNNKNFTMVKFRSMRVNTPNVATHLLTDSKKYITKVGRFIRKTSIDELPQLFNVLKGDMTLVGPRPALYNQEDLIALRTEKGVQTIKPGITGYAQINGRDDIEIPLKVELDQHYLNKKSIIFDISILIKTVFAVFNREGYKDE